jgi:hypothetical protein
MTTKTTTTSNYDDCPYYYDSLITRGALLASPTIHDNHFIQPDETMMAIIILSTGARDTRIGARLPPEWFELAHTGLPVRHFFIKKKCYLQVAAISGLMGASPHFNTADLSQGPALLTSSERSALASRFLPWALREGHRAAPLLQIR